MKTVAQLNKEIEETINVFDKTKEKKIKKKIYDHVLFLRFVVLYLETHPNEDFLKKTKQDFENKVKKLLDNYSYWSSNVCDKSIEVKNRKSIFLRSTGINELNKRIKTLDYILN